jgi:hypothetical protein
MTEKLILFLRVIFREVGIFQIGMSFIFYLFGLIGLGIFHLATALFFITFSIAFDELIKRSDSHCKSCRYKNEVVAS